MSLVIAAVSALVGCAQIADTRDRELAPPDASTGTGGNSGFGGSTGTSGAAGTAGVSGLGASGGTAGSVGGGAGRAGAAGLGGSAGAGGSAGGLGTALWSRHFGDAASEDARDVAIDSDGNLVVVGVFEGELAFGSDVLRSAGERDVFVAKLSPTGEPIWARRFGDSTGQGADPTRVAIDGNDDIIVVGAAAGTITAGSSVLAADGIDGYVMKIDGAGDPVWAIGLSGPNAQRVREVAVDPATNDIYVTGFFTGAATLAGKLHAHPGNGSIRMLVARLTPAGELTWSIDHGNDSADTFTGAIALAPGGDVVVSGYLSADTDVGGGVVTTRTPRSLFVARYDANGTHVRSAAYGSSAASNGLALTIEPGGAIYVLARLLTRGAVDLGAGGIHSASRPTAVLVAELDAQLNGVRGRLFDGADHLGGLGHTADGHVAMTANFAEPVDFGSGAVPTQGDTDIAILKLDGNFETVWSRIAGADGVDDANSLAATASSGVVVVGSFSNGVDFGTGRLTSAGGLDIFLSEYGP